jgi:retron-type reverse transcriptase
MTTRELLWNLSAAYNTIYPILFCKKAQWYVFNRKTFSWFLSFLTGRSQRFKVGQAISDQLKTEFGVPQGGILSPIIFIIYGADLEEWTNHSSILTYADDTNTSCHGKSQEEIMEK